MWHIERVRHVPTPPLHLFVCANRRSPNDPLGPGCGDAGEAVYAAMKDEVARRGAYRTIWIAKTHCLGICPKRGCTVVRYPSGDVFAEVEVADAAMLLRMEKP